MIKTRPTVHFSVSTRLWKHQESCVSFAYPIKTWVWRCRVWFCPQVLPPHVGPIQNQALRTCLGAFRTSPVTSLHVEANEMPLDLRRRMLSSKYCQRLSSNEYSPVRSCIFSSQFTKFKQITKYTLSNLSSAIVIWAVSVVRMLSFSGGTVSAILASPIHICWIDKINQNVLTVPVR